MAKITLDQEMFKALASETRLNILKALDGKNLGLNEISNQINLNKATLHEHLSKLHKARLVKRNDELEQKVDKLQEDMMKLLVEERDRLSELIRENTQALADLQRTILKYIVKAGKDWWH